MNQIIMLLSFAVSPLALVVGVLLGRRRQRAEDQRELDQAHQDHQQLVAAAGALQRRHDTTAKMLGEYVIANAANMENLKEWERVTAALTAKVTQLEGPKKPHLTIVR